jgi:hypothetical protein
MIKTYCTLHCADRMREREVFSYEIIETIQEQKFSELRDERKLYSKKFDYNKLRNDKFYTQKELDVILEYDKSLNINIIVTVITKFLK